jgi:hypothetical protein
MEIKYKKDWATHPKWHKVIRMDYMSNLNEYVIHTMKLGWLQLSDCIVRNGNFNT